jgi:hypothetical protein
MNRLLVTSLIFVCSYTFAHEPYVAPLAYKTEQTQVPVVAGYAEEALNSEYALKMPSLPSLPLNKILKLLMLKLYINL